MPVKIGFADAQGAGSAYAQPFADRPHTAPLPVWQPRRSLRTSLDFTACRFARATTTAAVPPAPAHDLPGGRIEALEVGSNDGARRAMRDARLAAPFHAPAVAAGPRP